MAKVKNIQKNVNSVIFLSVIITITVFLLVFTIVLIGKPFTVNSYKNMHEVNIDNYKTQEEAEYYVYVYYQESEKDEILFPIIKEYANFVRFKKNKKKIYVLNYGEEENKQIINSQNLNITDTKKHIPALVLIKNGSVSTKYRTVTDISNTLTKIIDEK